MLVDWGMKHQMTLAVWLKVTGAEKTVQWYPGAKSAKAAVIPTTNYVLPQGMLQCPVVKTMRSARPLWVK